MSVHREKERMFVSTTPTIPGYRTVEYIGVAFGITVRSRGVGGDCLASCESTCGGEVSAYTQMAHETRNQAINRLLDDAASMGANAVVNIYFDSDEIGQGSNNAVICYGTAVRVEKA